MEVCWIGLPASDGGLGVFGQHWQACGGGDSEVAAQGQWVSIGGSDR